MSVSSHKAAAAMKISKQLVLSSLPNGERRRLLVCRTISTRRPLISELMRRKMRVILSSTARRTTPGRNNMNVRARENRGAVEGSSDTNRGASRASFLNSSYLLKRVQNAYLSSTLCKASAIQDSVKPKPSSPSEFWEKAKKSEETLRDYVRHLLETAATYFKSTKFTDIMTAMDRILRTTAIFRNNIKDTLDAHQVTFDTLTKELEDTLKTIANELQSIPVPDTAPNRAERAEMVDKALDSAVQALTELATRYGIEEEVVKTYVLALTPQVQALMLTIGDINEQYPQLLPALTFSVTVLLLQQSWILKPFLGLFGFGPTGPNKGSTTASLQRRFWGAAVKASSWLSWLQAAGTGIFPKWAWRVAKSPLLRSALVVFLPYFDTE